MLQNKLGFIFLLVMTFLISCKKGEKDNTGCICVPIPAQNDTYIYPIRPGDSEWKSLSDGYQRVEACQVPEHLLKVMSTTGLVETCISHPLLAELIFSDLPSGGLQKAIEKQISMFNCFGELLKRSDAGKCLLARYLSMSPCCVENSQIDVGKFANSYSEFEMIFSQANFLEQLSPDELLYLIRKALVTYKEKVEYDKYYSWMYGMNTTAFLMARSMVWFHYKPFILEIEKNYYLKRFVNTSALPENNEDFKNLFEVIENNADDLLKNK